MNAILMDQSEQRFAQLQHAVNTLSGVLYKVMCTTAERKHLEERTLTDLRDSMEEVNQLLLPV